MDEVAEMDRPLCPCHGEAMTKRNDRRFGWRCSVGHREAQRDYGLSTRGIMTQERWLLRKGQNAS